MFFNAFSSATGKATRVARSKSVEREAASGRGARSSRLLRCLSYIHHFQNCLLLYALSRFFVKIFKMLIV